MPEQPSLTHKQIFDRAEPICQRLKAYTICPACLAPFGRMRPYRSIICAHSFCGVCAGIARGNFGPILANVASARSRKSVGICPVSHCNMSLRPGEIVEDIGIRDFRNVCHALIQWASGIDTPIETPMIQSQSNLTNRENPDTGDDIFNKDLTSGGSSYVA